MNRGRLIGGVICLALAGLLGVLNVTLSEDKLMFMVGDRNMPFLPPIILGIVGVFLLISAFSSRGVEENKPKDIVIDEDKAALNRRLEAVGWGLFLVMLGGFILVPGDQFPKGWWSIGVGLIMLGLNAARYFSGIRMSGFTTILGILAIISGALELAGMNMLEGAILLIILGAYILVKPWFEKQQLFGKAEES
jgi:uncharacterized membrane protein